jgi:hypothetical protein
MLRKTMIVLAKAAALTGGLTQSRRNSGWARMPHCRSPLREVRATNIWSDG